jgi:hypothetical protein
MHTLNYSKKAVLWQEKLPEKQKKVATIRKLVATFSDA